MSIIIDNIIKKHARRFISNKIKLIYEKKPVVVYTDNKLATYIIEQIISNSIKYANGKSKQITIQGYETASGYKLIIEDNGIGIVSKDLPKIFDKGFTGENGRKFGQSTGMGLYLCKTLCDKLMIGLDITSKSGYGTKTTLTFSKGYDL